LRIVVNVIVTTIGTSDVNQEITGLVIKAATLTIEIEAMATAATETPIGITASAPATDKVVMALSTIATASPLSRFAEAVPVALELSKIPSLTAG
jgi:hypothetical protein